MQNRFFKFFALSIIIPFLTVGCATTRARKPDPKVELQNQVNDLQSQLQAKDQQIQELQARVSTYEQALQSAPTPSYSGFSGGNTSRGASGVSKSRSAIIHVSGVSVEDVQKALVRAGYDPGPVDGHAGKKTKAAIRKFQRKNHLTADGIVGEQTWTRLK